MHSPFTSPWLNSIDQVMLWVLAPLAIAILLSGLDDLTIDVAWLAAWLRRKLRPRASLFPPGPRQLDSAPQKRIAILLPLWQEGDVIGQMIQHNIAAIRYPSYHFFAGAYPNDAATQASILTQCERFSNVHLVLCPHDGPTSKADCLNWIYQHVCLYEEQHDTRFDVLVTHDAEDLIHPDELRWINFYSTRYDFIQTPVLALATPWHAVTHGVYCDEFAEYHTRDMPVRPLLGGFLPSAGVGTGYRRDALRKLAESSSNRLFEPEALTEDYENGLKLFRLGCSQAFVPISRGGRPGDGRNFVATREFFPRDFRSALRQRTRWVMGIALQGWQRFGWSGKPGEIYWLWRDRKGLIANPLGLVSNVVFLYGLATGMWTRATPLAAHVVTATVCLQIWRLAVRMTCCARVYGIVFALGVPVRAIYANLLNATATFFAVGRYAMARVQRRPLKWMKTDHAYPHRAALLGHKRLIGEILVGSGHVSAAALRKALEEKPEGARLGDYMTRAGYLSHASLYEALGLQQGLPVADPDVRQVPPRIAHALPEHVIKRWNVLPFRLEQGCLHIASPDAPPPELNQALHQFTSLELRFSLMTPGKFEELSKALL